MHMDHRCSSQQSYLCSAPHAKARTPTCFPKGRPIPGGVHEFAGIRMHPLSEKLAGQLQGQEHWRSLMVDRHMRVKGTHNIFALGDAATIEQVCSGVPHASTHSCASCPGLCLMCCLWGSDLGQRTLLRSVHRWPWLCCAPGEGAEACGGAVQGGRRQLRWEAVL
jgi:hypothetical protein